VKPPALISPTTCITRPLVYQTVAAHENAGVAAFTGNGYQLGLELFQLHLVFCRYTLAVVMMVIGERFIVAGQGLGV